MELITELRKELAGQGLDAGPQTISWHLEHHHRIQVSAATVSRCLARAGLVTPEPRKRPKSSYLRFAAELPSQCWQSDFIHWQLAGGQETEILSWIDDHSRYTLRVTGHQRVTGPIVLAEFRAAVADCTADTHNRVRTDRLDANGCVTLRHGGKLYHIGTGRTHARTHVLLLIQDLHIRIINAATGELLRELTPGPTRSYQPTGRPPGPHQEHPAHGKTPNPGHRFGVIPMSCDITLAPAVGLEPTTNRLTAGCSAN
jgi:hypothetical protein